MRSQFLLCQSHLAVAHLLWQQFVQPGDIVVDATCGNGHDALVLAKMALQKDPKDSSNLFSGKLLCFDIQQAAIDATKMQLVDFQSQTTYYCMCHSNIASQLQVIQNQHDTKAKLIVYNLGYLPGGDKSLTTNHTTTIESIESVLECICPGGAISITLYPGHYEGSIEEEVVIAFSQTLDPKKWNVTSLQWTNRRAHPRLLLLQKALS